MLPCPTACKDWLLGTGADQSQWETSVGNIKVTDLIFTGGSVLIAQSLEVLVVAFQVLHGEAKRRSGPKPRPSHLEV